jgi:ribokinase
MLLRENDRLERYPRERFLLPNNRILVLGSTNIDLVAYTDAIPEAGETITGQKFQQSFGGKGGNQAIMAARTGVPVSIITGVGSDLNGKTAIQNFIDHNVDVSQIFTFPTTTGVAHIWVEANGENRIILIPGANHELSLNEVVTRFLKLDDISSVVAQAEIPIEITAKIFAEARARKIRTILNPAPFVTLPKTLLQNTDFLIVNEVEFQQLHPEGLQAKNDDAILSLPFNGFYIVTLGSAGAVLVSPNKEISKVSTQKVNAIDTTGAGDALIGAFAGALALEKTVLAALEFGIKCATQSVTRMGAQSSYLSRAECMKLLK